MEKYIRQPVDIPLIADIILFTACMIALVWCTVKLLQAWRDR